MNSSQLLDSGVRQLNIEVNNEQLGLLMRYVELLQKWNKTYNLTAIEEKNDIIIKHILDSLSVVAFLKGKNIIDVGSGAGLPGIPLAILQQDKNLFLLDSNVKKARFMQQAVIDLRLKNIHVIHSRVEDYQQANNAKPEINTLISRAFASSDNLFASCEELLSYLSEKGRIIFMLGKQNQLEALPTSYNVVNIHSINIPHLEAQRHIAVVEKTGL
ncbi:MAG: 16S rRNA (guanine(527)-N(7))-methyltransferase RsmG [Gammaproteobacteria bacterium]